MESLTLKQMLSINFEDSANVGRQYFDLVDTDRLQYRAAVLKAPVSTSP